MKTHHQEKCAHCKGAGLVEVFNMGDVCSDCNGIGVAPSPKDQEKCRCCASTPTTVEKGYHCPHCPLSAPSPHTEGWEVEFDKWLHVDADGRIVALFVDNNSGMGKLLPVYLSEIKDFFREKLHQTHEEDKQGITRLFNEWYGLKKIDKDTADDFRLAIDAFFEQRQRLKEGKV